MFSYKKRLVVILSLLMLLGMFVPVSASEVSGVFEGTGHGMQGPITVSVTVSAGKITGIEYLKYTETENIAAVAKQRIPEQIIAHQALGVDTLICDIMTCFGIINAVAD